MISMGHPAESTAADVIALDILSAVDPECAPSAGRQAGILAIAHLPEDSFRSWRMGWPQYSSSHDRLSTLMENVLLLLALFFFDSFFNEHFLSNVFHWICFGERAAGFSRTQSTSWARITSQPDDRALVDSAATFIAFDSFAASTAQGESASDSGSIHRSTVLLCSPRSSQFWFRKNPKSDVPANW